ncbi:Adrenodoxin, mitochondrial [Vanrija pseudolonga]|uniref:Adrenodoxin, mitochondrial n=1 Tax=Vanrija pseudolonga TaxID=143232 RepID=A0AAF1BFD2_9TREE|nr:Adrenodoxin, mitochondrial [Vanrija pseudolonga]
MRSMAVLRRAGALMRTAAPAAPLAQRPSLPKFRAFSATTAARHGELTRPAPGTGIKVTFADSKGNPIKTVEGNEGDDLLSLAHEHDVDLEGACERSVACSTCHVILEPEIFDKLPEADDEENDMLDLAFGLEDTSRLGCQVLLTRELDGMTAKLPAATRNMYVDGAKARTH